MYIFSYFWKKTSEAPYMVLAFHGILKEMWNIKASFMMTKEKLPDI